MARLRFAVFGLAGAGLLLAAGASAAPIETSSGGFWSLFDPTNDDSVVVSASVSSSTSSGSFWDQFASTPRSAPPAIPAARRGTGSFGRRDFATPAAVDGATAAIPEPGAALLFAVGCAAVALGTRRRAS